MPVALEKIQSIIETFASMGPDGGTYEGNFLLIYICNFHVLNNFLLIFICKLHWNRDGGNYEAEERFISERESVIAREGQLHMGMRAILCTLFSHFCIMNPCCVS